MLKFISIFLLSSLQLAQAFPITEVKLLNPTVSAGENLALRYTTNGAVRVDPIGGFTIWLGYIVQNVFINSMASNRQSRVVEGNTFEVTDLRVNPWVIPHQETYRLEQIVFYDLGLTDYTLAAGDDDVYWYYEGTWMKSEIPVITFHVKDNPNGDLTPPVISEVTPSKTKLKVGEKISFQFEATDERSGLNESLGLVFGLSHSVTTTINHRTKKIGDHRYEISDFVIDRVEGIPEDRIVTITQVGVQDRSGNWGTLRPAHPTDETYTDSTGRPTAIKVIKLEIER